MIALGQTLRLLDAPRLLDVHYAALTYERDEHELLDLISLEWQRRNAPEASDELALCRCGAIAAWHDELGMCPERSD